MHPKIQGLVGEGSHAPGSFTDTTNIGGLQPILLFLKITYLFIYCFSVSHDLEQQIYVTGDMTKDLYEDEVVKDKSDLPAFDVLYIKIV